MPADHPWASRQSIEPADLIGAPIILREPTSGTRKALLTELGKHDIHLEDLEIFLEVGNAEAIVETVSAGYDHPAPLHKTEMLGDILKGCTYCFGNRPNGHFFLFERP